MISRHLFDHPTIPSLRIILERVRDGDLLIPDVRRASRWTDEQRIDLFGSVVLGLPIGTLCEWRTRTSAHMPHTQASLGPFSLPSAPRDEKDLRRAYLVDGYQRLATLYTELTRHQGDGETRSSIIGFDLRKIGSRMRNKKDFVILRPVNAPDDDPALVPAWALLSATQVHERRLALIRAKLTHEADILERLANAFKDYPVTVTSMFCDDVEGILAVFARCGGAQLRRQGEGGSSWLNGPPRWNPI